MLQIVNSTMKYSSLVKEIVLVCPTHKDSLTSSEWYNLKISELNCQGIPLYFLLPRTISKSYFEKEFPNWNIISIDDIYFSTHRWYNKLLLSNYFYDLFKDFEFLILCQTDAIIIKDISLIPKEYDCIGAPWEQGVRFKFLPTLWVGNGGLTFRRVNKFRFITRLFFFLRWIKLNEDVVFSIISLFRILKTPNKKVANKIFLETGSKNISVPGENIGFHALSLFNPSLEKKIHLSYSGVISSNEF